MTDNTAVPWRVGTHYGIHALAEQVSAKCIRDDESGCLRWQGFKSDSGYGSIYDPQIKTRRGVHVVAYEAHYGPVPDGYHVDHVKDRGCIYRDCCEPTHLEAVTPTENWRRAHEDKPVCKYGHPMDGWEANAKYPSGGTRVCTTCRRDYAREKSARRWVCPICGIEIAYGNSSNHKRAKHAEASSER